MDEKPTITELVHEVRSPYWQALCDFIEDTWSATPVMEYSRCTMEPGWNVKYRKGNKAICTLYPRNGYFICMISVGGAFAAEAELALTRCDETIQALYQQAKPVNGSRWLMVEVRSQRILEDLKLLLQIRMKKK